MKLKERRCFQAINRIRSVLMDSELDIGVLIQQNQFQIVEKEYSKEEVAYALRYLKEKGYLNSYDKSDSEYKLTVKGYDDWLFPNGSVDAKSIFISYAIEDKQLAGKIKSFLDKKGYLAFLAHEDIEPTSEFRDRIISDLKTCSIFIALRTKEYIKKQFTEQECGFALALNKIILPLCIGTELSEAGFCSVFQGAKFKTGDEQNIFEYLKKHLD